MMDSVTDLPVWPDYFIPGGCWQFDQALLVNHLLEA